MIMTIKKLAEKVGCCDDTVRTYISRAEFSNVEFIKISVNKFILKNVTEDNIIRLKELVKSSKRKIGKNARRIK